MYFKKFKKRQTERLQEKLEQKYLPLRVNFYKKFINPNDLVFDVGANVGNRVGAFLKCHAKVVAVEPQPYCVKILREKFDDKITIEPVG